MTLLDYPQKVAAIVFTAGCNMRCPFCYNSQLVLPEQINPERLYDQKQVIDFLKRRKKYLDGLVITGGEPTLQADLPEWLAKMKKIGYAIKVDTNGLRPEVLAEIIEAGLVDYVAMDIKGPLENYEKFSGVKGETISQSIEIIMDSGLAYEFRSTIAKGFHNDKDIELMAKMVKGAEKYYLQNFYEGKILAPDKFSGQSFTQKELARLRDLCSQHVKNCLIR